MKKNLIIFKTGVCIRIFTLLLLFLPTALFGQGKITGTVTDASDGSPLPGANVVIKGTSVGAVTDMNGTFTLEAPADAVLVISFVGFLSETIEVAGQTNINVTLTPDLARLDEVVVIGYGTMKKSDLTGAVSSIKEEDIKSIKSSNAVEALQGKIAGVDMTRSDGRAGSGYNILIRGARSFSAKNDPIYIVDGIDYGSTININPSDIVSIEVLKDASSTAIYGSRGANGIVMVTTKKGSQGKMVVNFGTYYGYTTPLGKLPMGDADYYLRMSRDLYRTNHTAYWDSADASIPASAVLTPEELEGYTRLSEGADPEDYDWVKQQMKNHGNQADFYLSITGGTEKSNYTVSLNHFLEDNFIPNDNYKRYSIKSNVDSKVYKWLEIGNSTFLSYTDINRGRGINYDMNPFVKPYDDDDNLIIEPDPSRVPFTNPLIDQDPDFRSDETLRTGIFSSFYGQVNIAPVGLTFRTNFNVNLDFQRHGTYTGTSEELERLSEASLTEINTYKWTWTNVLTFDKTFSDHHIMATAATETRYRLTERYYQYGKDMVLADFKWFAIRTGDPNFLDITDLSEFPYTKETMVSFIGRLHYGYAGRYLVTLTGRHDGASQLVEKWDFFPAVSFAWGISNENFMKNQNVLSNLKYRMGVGKTGNYSVEPYQSLGVTTDYMMYYQFGVAENTVSGYRTGQLATIPKWESSIAANWGLDFGFLANRISGSFEYYYVWTKDILQQVILPPTSAVTTVLENIGKTESSGIEITLNSVNINKPNFKWSTSLTFSRSVEEITYLAGGINQDVANKWFVGEPLAVFYDWKMEGIWQTEEATTAYKYGDAPGEIKRRDRQAGDTAMTGWFSINDSDRYVLGTPRPKWTAGLNSTMNFYGVDLSIFVYARVGQMVMDVVDGRWSPDGRENSIERDYWTPNNPNNDYPKVDPGQTRSGWSEATVLQYKDGTFVKIKDITLGYTFPVKWTSYIGISNLRPYLSLKNYFVFGKYFAQGRYDPEAVNSRGESNVGFPAPKMIIVGLNVTF
ncbi:MAG: TonB-dependent receptor [Bacteroidales bacterium]|nr:TonB-dependent receptor [Bacteroidales bacterium]